MGEWQGPMMETSWRPNMVARLLTPGYPETMGAEANLSLETPTEVLVNGSPLSLLTSLLLTQVWIVHRPLLLQQPPTATPPTPAPTEPTTVSSIDVEGQCTEDGSNVLAAEFVIQNVRDSSVMADNGSGKLVLQKRDSSSLSASSLQKWQAAPLCNGKFKVINVGTGNAMSSGPWLYNPETKLLKSETGRWARAARKRKLKLAKKVRYIKGTNTPWNWFQWDIVQV